MDRELVSVIMPTYNRSSTIMRAVESVIKQSYPFWELYIIDDAGQDETEKIIKEHYHDDNRIHYEKNRVNRGPAFARNVGIMHSSGDYYAFLDSDDEWISTHLEEALDLLKKNKYKISSALWYEEICGRTICILQSDWYRQSLAQLSEHLLENIDSDVILFKNDFLEYIINSGFYCFHINTIVMKKEVIEQVGLFDENLRASEDMDLLYRIFEKYNLLLINKPHFIYHFGFDNIYAFNERETVFEKRYDLDENTKNKIIYGLNYKIEFFKKLKKRYQKDKSFYLKVKKSIEYNLFRRYLTIGFLEKRISVAGCGSTKVGSNTESGTKEVTETAEQSEEVKKESEQVVEITTENVKETEETAPASDKDKAGADLDDSGQEKPSEQTSKENRTEAVSTKNESANDKTSREEAAPTPKPAEKKPEQSTQTREEPVTEAKAISYSPDTVVALAIAKCQAGGMITTQDNLANALAEGRITQEEYNEYYPYDGLEDSYYSVFVETDLSKASTMSGQALGSEDAIAGYIADMLLLENSPVFNVVYAGTYTQNGTTFYEFRCLR